MGEILEMCLFNVYLHTSLSSMQMNADIWRDIGTVCSLDFGRKFLSLQIKQATFYKSAMRQSTFVIQLFQAMHSLKWGKKRFANFF